MTRMTEKQKRFADYYIESANAAEAAVKAGYSEKTARNIGCENLTKPYIKEYIDKQLEKMSEKRIMDAEEVMRLLTSIARDEEQEDVVVFGEEGTEIARKGMSAKDRLKAVELIGKRYGIWTEKIDLNGNLGVTIIDDVQDDEE